MSARPVPVAAPAPGRSSLHSAQATLFDTADLLPDGLAFAPDVISPADEQALIAVAAALPLQQARYKQYTARRRVCTLAPAALAQYPPLQALRDRLAALAGVPAADFVHVMVAEYQTGTPLGWHRDAPLYELIAGVSLGSPACLRFRPLPYADRERDVAAVAHGDQLSLQLAPRSAYVMQGAARWAWQHGVPPVPGLRYAVTMRTARAVSATAA